MIRATLTALVVWALLAAPATAQVNAGEIENRANAPIAAASTPSPTGAVPSSPAGWQGFAIDRNVQTMALFAAFSLGPIALLMLTSFVRINIVLLLLRQALGSPQIPGNQVLNALALLLTLIVMKPVGETVYNRAVVPYSEKKLTPAQAWEVGSRPIKRFMVDQIVRTNHQHYLTDLYDHVDPPRPGRFEPVYGDEYPFPVLATAFLLSEITTALVIGFLIYLPFLVVDLVVSSVLSAMGLVMLPPSLVAMPLKLILFVLADGWFLVSTRLLMSFAAGRS